MYLMTRDGFMFLVMGYNRNKERLDKFSLGGQIDRGIKGARTATVYSFKGLLEICRFSNQPNANKDIHNRNKARLDTFSRVIKMVTHEEKRDVVRDFTVYSFKGVQFEPPQGGTQTATVYSFKGVVMTPLCALDAVISRCCTSDWPIAGTYQAQIDTRKADLMRLRLQPENR